MADRPAPEEPPPVEPVAAPKEEAQPKAYDESTVGRSERSEVTDEDEEEIEYLSKSLWLFPAEHPVRAFCIRLITNVWFDRFILLMIIINAIFLALQDPLTGNQAGFNRVSYFADYVRLQLWRVRFADAA